MRRVHKLREAPARERYLTNEEETRLFAVLVGRRAHIRPIVVVALQTGMRQGEILGLRWEHVDFDQKTIYVGHTKTGRLRKFKRKAEIAEFRVFELHTEGSNSHRNLSPTFDLLALYQHDVAKKKGHRKLS